MRVLFWGTPAFAVPTLRALSGEGHDVVGVVTQPDRRAGRGLGVGVSAVKALALEEQIPVLQPERAHGDDFITSIEVLRPDVSVVVAYGQILKPEVLAVPRLGSVNIHASLLPELRGAAPIHWAIIRGYETTGITIQRMEAGLDSGPILYQVPEPIQPEESMSDLAERLAEIGAEAVVEALALLENGLLAERVQEHDRATYAPKLDRETAHLDWHFPATEVARWIRGLDAVPGAWSELGGQPVKLFCPSVESRDGAAGEVLEVDEERGPLVGAGEGSVRVGEVQPAGKRRMTGGAWVRGRGIRVGERLA
jgi:methionyl-tRNA formyltransferase